MPKIGRPRAEVVVTDEDRAALVRLTKRARVHRGVAFRARIVLACMSDSDTAVARRYGRRRPRWRSGAASSSSAGSRYDELRVGAPRTISDEQVETIIVKTLETTPSGETHWSTRSMAKAAGVSHTMVVPHLADVPVAAASHRELQDLAGAFNLCRTAPTKSIPPIHPAEVPIARHVRFPVGQPRRWILRRPPRCGVLSRRSGQRRHRGRLVGPAEAGHYV